MKCSTYQAVNVSAVPVFPMVADSSVETAEPKTITGTEKPTAGESMFENFVDEVDSWARRALAANGFGDYL